MVDNRLPLTQAAGGRNSRHIRALGCPSKNLVWKKGIDETMREGDGTTGRGTELADDHVQRERIARAVRRRAPRPGAAGSVIIRDSSPRVRSASGAAAGCMSARTRALVVSQRYIGRLTHAGRVADPVSPP